MAKPKIVDADSHVMEPADLWEKNLDSSLRNRAIRVSRDEAGLEYLEIDGKKSEVVKGGGLAAFGRLDSEVSPKWEENRKHGGLYYEEGVPSGARDTDARLKWMDANGVDVSLVYPTLGICWQNECDDPDLAAAYCRIYNDWLTDFCDSSNGRIIPIALVSLLRIEDGVKEIQRAAQRGAKGIYLFSRPANGIPYGDRYYDPFWAECQELGLPVGIHVSNTPRQVGRDLYTSTFDHNNWWMAMMYNPDCHIAFTTFFQGAVFERFPTLSVGVVETGCGWIAYWLEQMDSNFKEDPYSTGMKLTPSEYFQRQCWISGEPDEKTFPFMAQLVGADKLMWGSDYPHEEGHERPLQELKNTIGILSEEEQAKILGGNALRVYGLV